MFYKKSLLGLILFSCALLQTMQNSGNQILTLYNNTGIDLYIRIRSGDENSSNTGFFALEKINSIEENPEIFLLPKWTVTSFSCDQSSYPLRLRFWDVSYKPTPDITPNGAELASSDENTKNSLTGLKFNEFATQNNSHLALIWVNPKRIRTDGDYVLYPQSLNENILIAEYKHIMQLLHLTPIVMRTDYKYIGPLKPIKYRCLKFLIKLKNMKINELLHKQINTENMDETFEDNDNCSFLSLPDEIIMYIIFRGIEELLNESNEDDVGDKVNNYLNKLKLNNRLNNILSDCKLKKNIRAKIELLFSKISNEKLQKIMRELDRLQSDYQLEKNIKIYKTKILAFLRAGANVNGDPVHYLNIAINTGNDELVELLLNAGANVNNSSTYELYPQSGHLIQSTLLEEALLPHSGLAGIKRQNGKEFCNINIVRLLLCYNGEMNKSFLHKLRASYLFSSIINDYNQLKPSDAAFLNKQDLIYDYKSYISPDNIVDEYDKKFLSILENYRNFLKENYWSNQN